MNRQPLYHDDCIDSTPLPRFDLIDRRDAKRRAFTAFIRGSIFGAILATGAFIASAAMGQTPPEPHMSLEPGTGDCFAVVAIANRMGIYNQIETLHTEFGPVVLKYHTVGGHNATDADEVSVVSLPDGVAADPDFMALPDGETGRVCLFEFVGM
jgi:hypothetical protein